MKNIACLYADSYLSQQWETLDLSGKQICVLMQDIGRKREELVRFMKHFIEGSEPIIFDMTDIIPLLKSWGLIP